MESYIHIYIYIYVSIRVWNQGPIILIASRIAILPSRMCSKVRCGTVHVQISCYLQHAQHVRHREYRMYSIYNMCNTVCTNHSVCTFSRMYALPNIRQINKTTNIDTYYHSDKKTLLRKGGSFFQKTSVCSTPVQL